MQQEVHQNARFLETLSAEQRQLLMQKAMAKRAAAFAGGVIAKESHHFGLSSPQRAMWIHEQFVPGTTAYNVALTYRLDRELDVSAFRSALRASTTRHEIFRSKFISIDGKPCVMIGEELDPELQIEDFSWIEDSAERTSVTVARARSFHGKPFVLDRPPLLRGLLIKQASEEWVVALSLHHAVCDGSSIGLFLQELGNAYRAAAEGGESHVAKAPVQYADYVAWQEQWLSTPQAQVQLEYWRRQLTDLPVSRMRGSNLSDFGRPSVGVRTKRTLATSVHVGLRNLASMHQSTEFAVLLTSLTVLISRYCGEDEVVIGAPFEGRTQARFEKLIGPFINPLPLRTSVAGDPTFVKLLQDVKSVVLDALANQAVPIDKVIGDLRKQGSRPNNLFEVFLNRYKIPDTIETFPGLKSFHVGKEAAGTKFDLTLFWASTESTSSILAIHNSGKFSKKYINTFLDQLEQLLQEIVESPDLQVSNYLRLPTQVRSGQATMRTQVNATLNDVFEDVVRKHPDDPAVIDGATIVTYSELHKMNSRVRAAVLQAMNRQPGAVGILANSDLLGLSAIGGVLAACCHFVPLDPLSSVERLKEIVAACEIRVVLTSSDHAVLAAQLESDSVQLLDIASLPAPSETEFLLAPRAQPQDRAYVLFTSGTTGKPKGVVQNHENVLHHAGVYARSLALQPSDRMSLFAWIGFDAAMMDIFGAFTTGATLVPFRLREMSSRDTAEGVLKHGVTILHPTPTVLRHLVKSVDAGFIFDRIRAVVLGGEEASASDFRLFQAHFPPTSILINGLGPSESTLALQYRMDHSYQPDGAVLPVGFPVEGTEVMLLNDAGQEVGVLAAGEIVIRSRHVALGYHDLPQATGKAFREDPENPGLRTYHTGDIGRRRPDGALEFAGRMDRQIKLRGMRIDLAEVEAAIIDCEGIEHSAVLCEDTDVRNGKRLLAYCVAKSGLSQTALRTALRARMPEYMVPSEIIMVDSLPLMSNGKLDRRKLKEIEPVRPIEPVPPRGADLALSGSARVISAAWFAVLGRRVDQEDNFFDVGGHSLMLAELFFALNGKLSKKFSLVDLLRYPTIASFSNFISA